MVFDEKPVFTRRKVGRENAENVRGSGGYQPIFSVKYPDTDAGERFIGKRVENLAKGMAVLMF